LYVRRYGSGQLRAVKEQIAEIEKQNYKGFANQ